MPPKPKFTPTEVAAAALEIVKKDGVSALTARELGARMGTSARPIFTAFKNMEEVKWAAREIAIKEYLTYIGDFGNYTPAFKRIGMQMVDYAIHQPEVFKLLFMQKHPEGVGFQNTMNDLGDTALICIDLIRRDYDLTEEQATLLFEQMWTFCYGLCTMCAMKVCTLTEEEISTRLGMQFAGTVMVIKSGKMRSVSSIPQKSEDGKIDGHTINDHPYIPEENAE